MHIYDNENFISPEALLDDKFYGNAFWPLALHELWRNQCVFSYSDAIGAAVKKLSPRETLSFSYILQSYDNLHNPPDSPTLYNMIQQHSPRSCTVDENGVIRAVIGKTKTIKQRILGPNDNSNDGRVFYDAAKTLEWVTSEFKEIIKITHYDLFKNNSTIPPFEAYCQSIESLFVEREKYRPSESSEILF